ncbi:MAG: Hsp33 family molecular chaperone [Ahrensia sp.]
MTQDSQSGSVPTEGALDIVIPFQVDALEARGRVVQMGPAINRMLARHDYPEPVAQLLAEMVVLTVLLGTALKFNGKFIVQTQTDGPVSLLVVDFVTPDAVRAYARYDADAVAYAVDNAATAPEQMLGKGMLVLTVDQGKYMKRYQGIVQLDGTSLEEIAHNYFRQSEQIPTQVRLEVGRFDVDGERQWRAAGLLAQFLPESEERMKTGDLPGGDIPEGVVVPDIDVDDAWTEIQALVGTLGADELLDEQLGPHGLLYRLFHERGVRVYDGLTVEEKCSCSPEKVQAVIENMSDNDRAESVEDGVIKIKCEFCSTSYNFDSDGKQIMPN